MKTLYVCGPTVYAPMHIGNIRPLITFDFFNRAKHYFGEELFYVHNITDIDDKIIAKAKQEGVSEKEISQKYIKTYNSLISELNVLMPNKMPKVTENISGIISFIEKLIKIGKAYIVNGSVYFSVNLVSGYGELANRKLDEMRFTHSSIKKNPGDFAIWKKTHEGITFNSPWSQGRPGWHTECSYFIEKFFNGNGVDMHGGGIDLLFPHNENENIQYKALYNKNITKNWMHVGHINIDGTKMSKSLKNDLNAQTFINEYGANTLRMLFLIISPTAPIDLTSSLIKNAKDLVERFGQTYKRASYFSMDKASNKSLDINRIAKLLLEFNFSEVLKLIHSIIKKFNKNSNENTSSTVIAVMDLLGFVFEHVTFSKEEKEMLKLWEKYKKNKDWKKADALREQLVKKSLI